MTAKLFIGWNIPIELFSYMLSDVKLSVNIVSVIMLSVVAPVRPSAMYMHIYCLGHTGNQ